MGYYSKLTKKMNSTEFFQPGLVVKLKDYDGCTEMRLIVAAINYGAMKLLLKGFWFDPGGKLITTSEDLTFDKYDELIASAFTDGLYESRELLDEKAVNTLVYELYNHEEEK